ncbi:MAG TPA: YafY family protein, partial [Propionicimonas sp.]
MADTSARLLRLLSLLQMPRPWTGPELAARLGVSTRTVRTDVERLRGLGYPVDATRGAIGGYRLGAGAALPPLLLDDEEAVAVTVGLRAAASGSVAGVEESSQRALAKVSQVLPSRLRRRVAALEAFTGSIPPDHEVPTVGADTLSTISAACRDREQLRFEYVSHDGSPTHRRAEPLRLVTWGRRWMLVAWDLDRGDWRTFRVDRMSVKVPNGPRFAPREPPADDLAAYVARGVSTAGWHHRARLLVHASAQDVARRLPPGVGPVEEVGEDTCIVSGGADSLELLALYVGLLDADVEVLDNPELVGHLAR